MEVPQHPEGENKVVLLFNYCSVFHQFVPGAETLPCLDDIVFSAPVSEAVCQEQQDSKWDVCTFY